MIVRIIRLEDSTTKRSNNRLALKLRNAFDKKENSSKSDYRHLYL